MVTWNIGNLAVGVSANLTILVTAPAPRAIPNIITNTAEVSGAEADPNPANNTASTTTTVVGQFIVKLIDLEVTKTDSPDPVIVNSNLTYVITVTNNGPDAAYGITLTDTLPAGIIFQSAVPPDAVYNSVDGTVTWSIASLASGASSQPDRPGHGAGHARRNNGRRQRLCRTAHRC